MKSILFSTYTPSVYRNAPDEAGGGGEGEDIIDSEDGDEDGDEEGGEDKDSEDGDELLKLDEDFEGDKEDEDKDEDSDEDGEKKKGKKEDKDDDKEEDDEEDDDEASEVKKPVKINGKTYTPEQLSSMQTEHAATVKKTKAAAAVMKESQDNKKAAKANEGHMKTLAAMTVKLLDNYIPPPLSGEKAADMEPAQIDAYNAERQRREALVAEQAQEIKNILEGAATVEVKEDDVENAHDVASQLALIDERYSGLVEFKKFRSEVNAAAKMLQSEYNFSKEEANDLLLKEPSVGQLRAIFNLLRWEKGEPKEPEAKKKTTKKTAKAAAKKSNKATRGKSKPLGPAKDVAELDRRERQVERWEKSGRTLTDPERDAFVNEGIIPKRR